ncbi:MAG TPA: hypothetical protein VGF99_14235, partial [Myxococcota bacterium]
MRTAFSAFALTAAVAALAACGPRQLALAEGTDAPYDDDRVSVIGTDADGNPIRGSTQSLAGDDCILLGDDCITPEAAGDFCEREGGPYDVLVVDGVVVDIVCYPPAADGNDPTVEVVGDGDIDVPQNENNTTITFGEDTDGTPIEGDLVIDGNNVAVYGNGVEETVLVGNVVLDGNNVRLRGLTIDGDLTLAKNNLAVMFVKVTGSITIVGNNSV